MHTTYMAHSLSEYVRLCSEETINWLPVGFLFYQLPLLLQNGHNNCRLSFCKYISFFVLESLFANLCRHIILNLVLAFLCYKIPCDLNPCMEIVHLALGNIIGMILSMIFRILHLTDLMQ
jgi:hypothetical protein